MLGGRSRSAAAALVKQMTVAQVYQLSEDFFSRLTPSQEKTLPIKRMKAKERVFCAISEVYGRLQRFERVEVEK